MKKQVMILLAFFILLSVAAIIHGIFLDPDFTQIKTLTLEGLFLTIFKVYPSILFWNRYLASITKKLGKLEK